MAHIDELRVERYRGIKGLRIRNLKRMNLILGDHNCGKTSVLEAIQRLGAKGSADVIQVARQRDALAVEGASSAYDSFICMFPRDHEDGLSIAVSGICDGTDMSFSLAGRKDRILPDPGEPDGATEAEAFDGVMRVSCGRTEKEEHIRIHPYSGMNGAAPAERDQPETVYVSPYDHLMGNSMSHIRRNETCRDICVKALQSFDPDIEDLMIFQSDTGDRPAEYLRHRRLGDMPVSTYGDGLKNVLTIFDTVAQAAGGILLMDEMETWIHANLDDDIFRWILKACITFDVQVFITTHSLEVIDGILAAQDYENGQKEDDVCVCTLKRDEAGTLSRVLSGRHVYENRESFGFDVRV
ncbi:MAG: AAA family ATPase [Clostridia bacterium]|nr:AAA family ATPase [Clostridia bacterium]